MTLGDFREMQEFQEKSKNMEDQSSVCPEIAELLKIQELTNQLPQAENPYLQEPPSITKI